MTKKIPSGLTHIIVRDFRGERLFLTAAYGNGFTWSANRRYALRFPLAAATRIIREHTPYATAENEVAAMHIKDKTIVVPRFHAAHDQAVTAAAANDAYNDAMRAARLIGRMDADYRRTYSVDRHGSGSVQS